MAEDEAAVRRGVVLQLHGGGYYGGMHNTYRDTAAMYAEVSGGFDVLTPDYRTAPEHPYPAALSDALAAYRLLLEMDYEPSDIVIAGDSAGGGLTLALALYLRDNGLPMPGGIITMSAWTDLTKSGASYTEHFGDDPIFGGTYNTMVYKDGYFRGSDPWDPYISPVFGSYENFPPTLMQVGEREMLLDDTRDVARKLKEAGVPVREHVYPGMFHVFQLALLLFPESAEAWHEVRMFFKKVTGGKENEGNK
ncbi:MAG: alpha/beta hydrolase [Lachnospiraceae bacterium]|nr:alpha/beta hydrolase [Lachnospiraceae bacterium]